MNENRYVLSSMVARVKLTLHAEERFFGPGVCELLERIGQTGSIQAAAGEMEMSYTKAWRILNRAEKAMGIPLITRMSGGRRGGSSTLTAAGEAAIRDFREMEAALNAAADALLKRHIATFAHHREDEAKP